MADKVEGPEKEYGVTTVNEWCKKLPVIASNSGIHTGSRYNSEAPSRRVEGAFGRDEDGPALENVCLLIDNAESMNAEKFESVKKDIQMMVMSFRKWQMANLVGDRCRFHVIYWGSGDPVFYQFHNRNRLAEDIAENRPPQMGEADLSTITEWIPETKFNRAEVFIFFTDGKIKTRETDRNFCMKNRNKILWVLTPDAGQQGIDTISNADPFATHYNSHRIFGAKKEEQESNIPLPR